MNNDLFGFGMIINVDNLKCDGQCPKLMQALAMLMAETKHSSMLMTLFKIFHEILSGPGTEESLHLLIAFLNSSFKKESYSTTSFEEISFKNLNVNIVIMYRIEREI